ncbi:MAG: helix-hairpin-helix domain-containing protein [Gemmatimonadota bacterium]|nr:helix-hairpin-helix domain-containing protein [Gemmatimonadota bacterium]
MPTPSEQKALAFVAIVILLGGAVRVLKAGPATPPTFAEQQGLAAQAAATQDAARSEKQGKAGRKRKPARASADSFPHMVAGVASVPPTYARPDAPFGHIPYGAGSRTRMVTPPSPRIDSDVRGARVVEAAVAPPPTGKKPPTGMIDIDHATSTEIEALPRIGPATARRIVANRDSLGPFGSLASLRRVKGMGPASLARLAPFITFGGRPAGNPNPP